jgi:predicted N-acetyltransferase YhbS
MEVVHADAVTTADWEQIAEDEEDPFNVGGMGLAWRPKELHTVGREGGRILAHVGLTVAVMVAGGREFTVAGVGSVVVTPPERGRGRLTPVMEAALARAAALGPEFAILFCGAHNEGLYARYGFATIAAPVTIDQPEGATRTMPDLAMWRALREGARWPDGPVRLRGHPF